MKILVVNAGSSTLKLGVIDPAGERVQAECLADWGAQPARLVVERPGQVPVTGPLREGGHAGAVRQMLDALGSDANEIAAVGHRVVHGGAVYTTSVRIDTAVQRQLAELSELAPLHNPANLEGIAAATAALPHVPHVAVFDTAFHATLPEYARVYPVPYEWYRDWGLRRYGFHGLSHAYCAGRAAEMLGRPPADLRLVICHLGNGCSVSAVRGGVCVDTSMGFTPLDGLMMGTRTGSVDPGMLLHVLRHRGLTPEQLDTVLNHRSGLLGISGVAADMRQVLQAAATGNERAALALQIFTHRLRQTIGGMAATLGGVDALVFTAGVGENAAAIRAMACSGLECLGLVLDPARNDPCTPDIDVSATAARARILVLHTREDLVLLRETMRVAGLGG